MKIKVKYRVKYLDTGLGEEIERTCESYGELASLFATMHLNPAKYELLYIGIID